MILDTNALLAFSDGEASLLATLETTMEICVPVIVLGEYRYGIRQSRYRRSCEKWLEEALKDLTVLPVLDRTTREYARVFLELKQAGTPIPINDVWIAAICREYQLPIISRDRHFSLVSGLKCISW
jgi:predicted nucleic acid-binding protein